MPQDVLARYCDRYAEPIATQFHQRSANLLHRSYNYVVCVPAYDEPPEFVPKLLSTIKANILVILVLNAPMGKDYFSQQQQTQETLRSLTQSPEQLSLIPWNSEIDLLVVDCCILERQLPLRQGVGLARKIACDLAIACILHRKVQSPWIYCTDADVQLPGTYFDAIQSWLETEGSARGDYAAMLYPFRHEPLHDNILQYEISLRYYVLELAQAGSPYAFQTVGSSMATHAKAYVAVRGFPKRDAAEDFYILNKLAKAGLMVRLNTVPLTLSSRRSHRVPFGTGAAMNRLQDDPVQLLYHPEIFVHLKSWFQQMERLWEQRDRVQDVGLETWWQSSSMVCDAVLPILIQLGLPKVLKQAYRQCRDRPHFLYYLHVWFDAFRTLRFVHLMRDVGFSSLAIIEYQRQFLGAELKLSSLQGFNHKLAIQESQLSPLAGPTQLLGSRQI